MQLDEFSKICKEKQETRKIWPDVIRVARELALIELPIALKAHHQQVISEDETRAAHKKRQEFEFITATLKNICMELGIEAPELYASDLSSFDQ